MEKLQRNGLLTTGGWGATLGLSAGAPPTCSVRFRPPFSSRAYVVDDRVGEDYWTGDGPGTPIERKLAAIYILKKKF
jgi:hypothetical protein